MDIDKIQRGIRMVLEGMGEDPEREGLRDTPRRVAGCTGTSWVVPIKISAPSFRASLR